MSENLSSRELHSLCNSANQNRKAVLSGRHVVVHHHKCMIGEHTISSFAVYGCAVAGAKACGAQPTLQGQHPCKALAGDGQRGAGGHRKAQRNGHFAAWRHNLPKPLLEQLLHGPWICMRCSFP